MYAVIHFQVCHDKCSCINAQCSCTYTAAECSARQPCEKAFAPWAAAFLAGTLGQLLTTCRNRWKSCPTYLLCLSCLSPPPVGWTADLCVRDNCLFLDDPSLVGSMFHVLLALVALVGEIPSSSLLEEQRDPALPHQHQSMHLICYTQQRSPAFANKHQKPLWDSGSVK